METTNRIRNPRILFAIDYFHRTGGTETHLAQLVRLLSQHGIVCSIVVFDLGENALVDGMRASGVRIHHLPVKRIYAPNGLWQGLRLAGIIIKEKVDVVQTFHQTSDTLAALVARLVGVKHVISSKRDTGQLKGPLHVFLNRRFKALFEKVIVVADAVGKAVIKTDGIDPSRLVRIYNGVDLTRFGPPDAQSAVEARRSLGFDKGDFVVGMVAGFRPEKNYQVFFEGGLKASQSIPSLKLLAVGGGPRLDHFRAIYDNEQYRSRIVFTGDKKDIRPYLAAMDAACLIPGGNEGFSNAVLEKMATGLPMIVSDVGGNAEAVLDGINGLVIPPNDTDAFCAALIKMHSDENARLEMGRQSRRMAEEKFDLRQMGKSHADLYRQLCGLQAG
ncbi:MAG TPA: glycosyltransferase [Burkholderiales bacterium]|nr:glycosyltransferase [Burkholderiales bacterium]